MKKSQWLDSFEKEINALQNKNASSKNVIFIIIPIMFLLFAGMSIAGGASIGQAMPLIGIGAGLFLLSFVLVKKSSNKDNAKGIRENLMQLLTSDEQVDEFDRQMARPLCVVQVDMNSEVIITEEYIVSRWAFGGMPDCRLARIRDIAGSNMTALRNGGAMGGKTHMIDLLDVHGKKILGISVDGDHRLQALMQVFAKYCPNIK